MTTTECTIRRVAADEATSLVDPLADVLIDCVEGGASVSFMAPLTRERAEAFFKGAPALNSEPSLAGL